jgi:hypothetical protein
MVDHVQTNPCMRWPQDQQISFTNGSDLTEYEK